MTARTPMTIVIDMDQVTIEGMVVPRPANVSRSEWMKFWERVQQIKT